MKENSLFSISLFRISYHKDRAYLTSQHHLQQFHLYIKCKVFKMFRSDQVVVYILIIQFNFQKFGVVQIFYKRF